MVEVFDPTDFYLFASCLYSLRHKDNESVVKRTIISRAYYSSLICCSKKFGIPTTGPNGHMTLINQVGKHNTRLGNSMRDLNELRRASDYESKPISDKEVQRSLMGARYVLSELGYIDINNLAVKNFLDLTQGAVGTSAKL